MKFNSFPLTISIVALAGVSASAAIRYVDVHSTNPAPPYTTWLTAAATIQEAIDAATAGDQILVTNGVYQTGETLAAAAQGTNRVTVTKTILVRSVNGAAVTSIEGLRDPATVSDNAVRCVYLASGAGLEGFTLTNGFGAVGGGVLCESLSAVVSNCVFTGNSAGAGGGVSGGTLYNCTLRDNSARYVGGGASQATLYHCTLAGNSAVEYGGGVFASTLYQSIVTGNSAGFGGGGAAEGTLINCELTGNSAWSGGGAHDAVLQNCTVSGNSASESGGGVYGGTVTNSIVYYNSAPESANYSDASIASGESTVHYFSIAHSCTVPFPSDGSGNLTNAPGFLDQAGGNLRLQAGSPCINSGSNAFAPAGPDLDGNPRTVGATVDIGAYEFQSLLSLNPSIRYVNVNNTHPAPPYTNWTTAAITIQAAVDAAVAGDEILVTNGVYQVGGRPVVFGEITNRVALDKPVTVRGFNGATVTMIRGFQVPGTTNGDSAIRCVYLTNGAALVGFTLAGGATRSSGDYLREFCGGGVWSESTNAVVTDCTMTGNSAYGNGGGAFNCTLNSCALTGNWARGQSGGADRSILNNCALTANSAGEDGGGAGGSILNNCALSGNSAQGSGGGVDYGTLNNCTLTGNSAGREGGGAHACTLHNCIVYYNSARFGDNYSSDSSLSYSCTTPRPAEGVGNISAEPQLANASHLSANSPCRGAGSAAYSTQLDIDGETWVNPPSIGCDEYHLGAAEGPLSVFIQAGHTNVAVGFLVNFTAAIEGHAAANRWEFGDGTVLSNRPYASYSFALAGDYSVEFRAYNDAYPDGISAMLTLHVLVQPIHYVALDSLNPLAPYSSWATAANKIQDAIDATSVPGALVLVTNGVYKTGGQAEVAEFEPTNRVAVTKPLVVRSVNGAAVTVISGYGDPGPADGDYSPLVRCVYLAKDAALVGFTLSNGAVGFFGRGGGVWCESATAVVSNCVLTGNSVGVDGVGGGAYGGTLNNCTISGNSAILGGSGGGAASCTLNNCTVTGNLASYGGGAESCALNNCILFGNSAGVGGGVGDCTLNNCTVTGNAATDFAGGAYRGTLNNCIVYYNSAPNGNNSSESVLNYCCTTPLPTNGFGNIADTPLLADYAVGNLRLQANSPCINAGSNASAPPSPDLDGNPRIAGGTVDIGAYEDRAPQSLISYAWLQRYALTTDGSADDADADGDGLNNWQEWRTGTNPTNALSGLRLLSPSSGAPGLVVSWQSVSGLSYHLDRATDLRAQAPFLPLATNIVGQPGTTTFRDAQAIGAGPFFYRVGVEEEPYKDGER